MSQPELLVVAGPNGAGKSTFIGEFLAERTIPYLCADVIALEFTDHSGLPLQVAAGREFLRRAEERLSLSQDFLIETTMSGRTLVSYLRRAKAPG